MLRIVATSVMTYMPRRKFGRTGFMRSSALFKGIRVGGAAPAARKVTKRAKDVAASTMHQHRERGRHYRDDDHHPRGQLACSTPLPSRVCYAKGLRWNPLADRRCEGVSAASILLLRRMIRNCGPVSHLVLRWIFPSSRFSSSSSKLYRSGSELAQSASPAMRVAIDGTQDPDRKKR